MGDAITNRPKRNPKWHRDEIILALDLYFSKDRGSIDSRNPKVIELSRVLNLLPIYKDRPDKEKFRNPNGVSLKLSNFQHFDPDYKGKGMSGGSKLDELVFKEFYQRREGLKIIASEIKRISFDKRLSSKIATIEEDETSDNDSVREGQVLYRLHKVRERDREIVIKKKKDILKKTERLACEVCGFDFYSFYGELGKGFIECHHRTPLSSLNYEKKTTLADLALVCSNCHRMLHRNISVTSVESLKNSLMKLK